MVFCHPLLLKFVINRPIAPVSPDSKDHFILTPSILLNQTSATSAESYEQLNIKDMYQSQWKHMQVLAEIFRKRRQEYLPRSQPTTKWQAPNTMEGGVILLKDRNVYRNEWPIEQFCVCILVMISWSGKM